MAGCRSRSHQRGVCQGCKDPVGLEQRRARGPPRRGRRARLRQRRRERDEGFKVDGGVRAGAPAACAVGGGRRSCGAERAQQSAWGLAGHRLQGSANMLDGAGLHELSEGRQLMQHLQDDGALRAATRFNSRQSTA